MAMKRTWQPKKKKGLRKHGYLQRSKTKSGKDIIKRRRARGRAIIAKKDKRRKMLSYPKHTAR